MASYGEQKLVLILFSHLVTILIFISTSRNKSHENTEKVGKTILGKIGN